MFFDKILSHPTVHNWLVQHGYRFDASTGGLPKLTADSQPVEVSRTIPSAPKHRWVRDKATGEAIVPVIDTFEPPTEGGAEVITTKILKKPVEIRRAGTPDLSQDEIAELRRYEINPENALEAKRLWLAGLSPLQAEKSGSSGYQFNGLKKIWAALAKANGLAPVKSNLRSRRKGLPSRKARGGAANLSAV